MKRGVPSNLVVVGDRVLVEPERGQERTRVGLFLPESSVSKNPVRGGRVVAVGPGTAVASPADLDEEPWKASDKEPKYVPMQARIGDFALFLKNAAVELNYQGNDYLIVPQGGILLLVRDKPPAGDEPPPGE